MTFGDSETFVYRGLSPDGAERWLASMLEQAERGEDANVPIDEKKDSRSVVEAKLAQRAANVKERMKENERSLSAMDAALMLADHTFVKGVPAAVNFLGFPARARPTIKAKFAAVCNSGKLEHVGDGVALAAKPQAMTASLQPQDLNTGAPFDEDDEDDLGDLTKMGRPELNKLAIRLGVADAEAYPNKTELIKAVKQADADDTQVE